MSLGEWVVALSGTAEGGRLAVALAIMAAVLHAAVSAMQKGRFEPWISRAAIDCCYCVGMIPAILWLPLPTPDVWPILAAAVLAHTFYKVFQAMAFSRGAFTVVYPVARGSAPLVTVLIASVVFSETLAPLQWLGLSAVVSGIFGLAISNLVFATVAGRQLLQAIFLAMVVGVSIAAYTTIDAYGVRATTNPFTFLAWLFFLDGFFMPAAVICQRRGLPSRQLVLSLMPHGVIGAAFAVVSFGSIMIATRLDQVGQIAILRETSIVFAAIIGWLILKEPFGFGRMMLIALIAAGAAIVELGG